MTNASWLVSSAALYWLMLLVAGVLRHRAWTPRGVHLTLSNRDQVPAPGPIAARADRAATNMLENLVLLIAVIVAVGLAGRESPQTQLGAAIFFWARLAYWPVYVIGIPYLRTLFWFAAMVGIGMIAAALL